MNLPLIQFSFSMIIMITLISKDLFHNNPIEWMLSWSNYYQYFPILFQ